MKKIVLLIVILLCLSGCTNIGKASIDTIISEVTGSKVNLANQIRTGYKYYLPSNLNSIKALKLNEVFGNNDVKYYLFTDLVSYYYGSEISYTVNQDVYYSKEFSYNKQNGYIEINVNNNKYLIEIIYNYAKIEVIVDKEDINEAVANGLIVLSSINYNRNIIENMLGEDVLNYTEESFSIFDSKTKDSNFLEYVQEYDTYKSEIPDYDLIN